GARGRTGGGAWGAGPDPLRRAVSASRRRLAPPPTTATPKFVIRPGPCTTQKPSDRLPPHWMPVPLVVLVPEMVWPFRLSVLPAVRAAAAGRGGHTRWARRCGTPTRSNAPAPRRD